MFKKDRLTALLVLLLVLIKFLVHLYSNGNYGFHRDELLHIAAGDHLDWGYMEFPPLIGWLARFSLTIFGDSVLAIRVLPALAGGLIVLLSALVAKELKGSRLGILLACFGSFCAIAYWRNHTLFQPVVFDQLFWTLGFYFLLRYTNTLQFRYLIFMGLSAGFGLLNKYTMLFWGAGLIIGLLMSNRRQWLISPRFLFAGGISLLLFLPNIWWQYRHDFPVLQHFSGLYDGHFDNGRLDFLISQVLNMNPLNAIIWIFGVGALLTDNYFKDFRYLGWMFLAILTLFMITNGKSYYLFSIYPTFIAAGAIWWDRTLKNKWRLVIYIYMAAMLFLAVRFIPLMTPILSIQQFAEYADLEFNENGQLEGLSGDYADMFGWEEQVALVDSLYRSLSSEEQAKCIIWAENYGEAGAIHHLGKKYQLPEPVSKHGSFWKWGPPEKRGEITISIGNEEDAVPYFYEEVEFVKNIRHPYAIDEEQNIPLYLCRNPKITLAEYWPQWRAHIFD